MLAFHEGIKAYAMGDGRLMVFRISDHISRLFDSARVLRMPIPYTKEELEKAVLETLLKNHATLATNGIRVKISSVQRPHRNLLPTHAKISGCYLSSILARMEANENGFDDAILLDYKGYVAEGTGANIFLVDDGKIFTPRPDHILLGVTRDSVITIARNLGYTVIEKDLTVKDLKTSEELFFSGTAVEITPIVEVDKKKIGDGSIGNVTLEIRKEYFEVLNGNRAAYRQWLKLVDARSIRTRNRKLKGWSD